MCWKMCNVAWFTFHRIFQRIYPPLRSTLLVLISNVSTHPLNITRNTYLYLLSLQSASSFFIPCTLDHVSQNLCTVNKQTDCTPDSPQTGPLSICCWSSLVRASHNYPFRIGYPPFQFTFPKRMYPINSIAVAWLANARETKPNQIEDHCNYLDALFPHCTTTALCNIPIFMAWSPRNRCCCCHCHCWLSNEMI